MRPWNPYAQTFHGAPIINTTPVGLIVHGPPMTPQTAAFAQATYASFCARARLSVVTNVQEHGQLADGSRFQISSIAGLTKMTVWTIAPNDLLPTNLLHGVMKLNDYVELPQGGFGYDEFHEVGKNGYVISKKFVRPNGSFQVMIGQIWQCFSEDSYSGPAAKLAQFGRGAMNVYEEYLRRTDAMPNGRSIGDGIFIMGENNDRRAYCYRFRPVSGGGFDMAACPMKLVSSKGLVRGPLPREIRELFGDNIPIPPDPDDWRNEYLILSSEQIREASRLPTVSAILGASTPLMAFNDAHCYLEFPRAASTGTGRVVHTLAARYDGAADFHKTTTTLLRITLSDQNSGGQTRAIASVNADSAPGVVGFQRANLTTGLPIGEFTGVCAVTHYNGTLTTFTRRIKTVEYMWYGTTLRHDTLFDEMTVDGGYSGKFMMWEWDRGRQTVSADISFSATREIVGQDVETDSLGDWWRTDTWARVQDVGVVSATVSSVYAGSSRKLLRSFGKEGVFMVTEVNYRPCADVVMNGNFNTRTTEYRWLISTVSSQSPLETFAGPPPVILIYTARSKQAEFDGYTLSSHYEVDVNPKGHAWYAPDTTASTIDRAMQPFNLHIQGFGWMKDPTGSITHEPSIFEYVGTKVLANGLEVPIDSAAFLNRGDTASYIQEFFNSPEMLKRDPIFAIRKNALSDEVVMSAHASYLGGKNAVVNVQARMFRETGFTSAIHASFTAGNMVSTAKDKNYPRVTQTRFIGEMPP